MNLYFLVEGKRTEKKVYPKWLEILVPELQKVTDYQAISTNNYYVFSGNGFPSLLKHLQKSVEDINETGNYDYLVICLDADEQSIENCRKEILDFMNQENISLNPKTKFEIIVQNKCLETWFLGNAKIFKNNPENENLKKHIDFYNVQKNDPELMGKPADFEGSPSIFHAAYLQEIFAERKMSYSKKNLHEVIEPYFLQELIKRNQKTGHIESFKYFIDFCAEIRKQIIIS